MANTSTEQHVSDLLDAYIASFNAGDYAKAASYYSEPSMAVSASSVNAIGTHQERTALLESTVARLRQQGFTHSEWSGPKKIIVLDEKGLVLASCSCKRLRKDRSSVEEFTATYTLSKLDGLEWKIVSIHQHPFETQLK